MSYRLVEVPANPTAALAVFTAQLGEGYQFVGWHWPPGHVDQGVAIFFKAS